MCEESCQRVLLHGFDFAAESGERFATNLAQDFRVAPLAMQASRTETAFENTALHRELMQGILNNDWIERKAFSRFAQCEGPVRASIAAHEFENRLRHRIDERSGQARRKRDAECVTITSGIFHGNEAAGIFTAWGNPKFEQTTSPEQAVK